MFRIPLWLGVVVVLLGPAQAVNAELTAADSFLEIRIGWLPHLQIGPMQCAANCGALSPAGGSMPGQATLASEVMPSPLITSQISVTTIHNGPGIFQRFDDPNGTNLSNPAGPPIPVAPGSWTGLMYLQYFLDVFAPSQGDPDDVEASFSGPWVTGTAMITGITTTVVSVPALGGWTGVLITLSVTKGMSWKPLTTGGARVSTGNGPWWRLNTVTVQGTNGLWGTSSKPGQMTFISPMRVLTTTEGLMKPGVVRLQLAYNVPEPSSVLMLIAGEAYLILLGIRRGRKLRHIGS